MYQAISQPLQRRHGAGTRSVEHLCDCTAKGQAAGILPIADALHVLHGLPGPGARPCASGLQDVALLAVGFALLMAAGAAFAVRRRALRKGSPS